MIESKPWKLFWPDASHPDIEKALATALNGEIGHFQGFCPTVKGTPKWWDVTVTAVPEDGRRIASLLAVSRDMTTEYRAQIEQERLIKEVQAANERMADVFSQAPAFMCVLRGPDHVFELINDRYLQLVGHRQLVGQPVRQALPEIEGQGFLSIRSCFPNW